MGCQFFGKTADGKMKTAAALVMLLLNGLAGAQAFDLHNAFTTEANPSNGWAFGSSKSVSGFEPYTNNTIVGQLYGSRGQSGLVGWSRPEGAFPFAARNQGTTTMYQRWRPGDVVLHPTADLFSIARWTNQAGTLRVRLYVTFRRVENVTPNDSTWYVVANGKVVDSGTLSLGNEERSVTETLEIGRGGTIALVVGCKAHMEGTDLSVSALIDPKPASRIPPR